MPTIVTIDRNSGFCFGVTKAIREAERRLAKPTAFVKLKAKAESDQIISKRKNKDNRIINTSESIKSPINTNVLIQPNEPSKTCFQVVLEQKHLMIPNVLIQPKRQPEMFFPVHGTKNYTSKKRNIKQKKHAKRVKLKILRTHDLKQTCQGKKRSDKTKDSSIWRPLYCLGEIVHNNEEVQRLEKAGLKVIDNETFATLHDAKVLIRAHGEPPETYRKAKANNIELVDATCPIVLKLQQRIREGFEQMQEMNGQVLIYGKPGHAEVIGLNGQTGNKATVVSSLEDLEKLDFSRPTLLYSQTTMNTEEYRKIVGFAKEACSRNGVYFKAVNSICQSMSHRAEQLEVFAKANECVFFVSGKQSSNGKYLYGICRHFNENTFFVSSPEELHPDHFTDTNKRVRFNTIGVCGATSTPMWLMEAVAGRIKTLTGCI